jgi:hypothetical protein
VILFEVELLNPDPNLGSIQKHILGQHWFIVLIRTNQTPLTFWRLGPEALNHDVVECALQEAK